MNNTIIKKNFLSIKNEELDSVCTERISYLHDLHVKIKSGRETCRYTGSSSEVNLLEGFFSYHKGLLYDQCYSFNNLPRLLNINLGDWVIIQKINSRGFDNTSLDSAFAKYLTLTKTDNWFCQKIGIGQHIKDLIEKTENPFLEGYILGFIKNLTSNVNICSIFNKDSSCTNELFDFVNNMVSAQIFPGYVVANMLSINPDSYNSLLYLRLVSAFLQNFKSFLFVMEINRDRVFSKELLTAEDNSKIFQLLTNIKKNLPEEALENVQILDLIKEIESCLNSMFLHDAGFKLFVKQLVMDLRPEYIRLFGLTV
jgi:hypothetical protein